MATDKTKAAEATENIKKTKADEAEEERVEVFIPKGYVNDEPNLFVGVNGVNYLLPKGKTSLVPRAVKYEIDRAIKAQEVMDNHIDEMKAASK